VTPLTLMVDLNPNHQYMYNPPPYAPPIPTPTHLSDNISVISPEVQRRRAEEDNDGDFESDGDSYQDLDDRGRDYDYEDRSTRRDLPDEAVFFTRREGVLDDDLELGRIERKVAEAARVLEEAKRELKEVKLRIRNRRREERQQFGNHSHPRTFVDDERVGCTAIRRYIAMLTDFLIRHVCVSCEITCLWVERNHLPQRLSS
jgi:hypothetical protein